MPVSNFVHLHVHSDYTLLDGAAKVGRMVSRAAALDMPALALTDGGNLFGAIGFYQAARRAGIKPILGMQAYLTRGSRFEKSGRTRQLDQLVLLARNRVGWLNLMKIATAGYLEGFYYKPRIDYEFLEDHAEGLIALSGGMSGAVTRELLSGRPRQALEIAGRHKEIFKGDYYLELQNHGLSQQSAVLSQLLDTGRRAEIPVVASNDVHYLAPGDAAAQEILVLIQQQRTIADANRYKSETDQRYFKDAAEMIALFESIPEAIENTLAITERIDLELELGDLLLPHFPLPEGFATPEDYLEHLTRAGLKDRYSAVTPEIEERLRFELGIILQMGYAGYFLIVQDFIRHAREIEVSVGPGRGSAAGSLVAYCLGITDIDPIQFGLLFERFLNPERVSMPDIDVDFDDRRRGEIIEYVKQKYGEHSVTQIITFGTMAARGVIRDVSRALGLEFGDSDRIAKLIPAELGITLEKALEQVPELREMGESDTVYGRLLRVARTLEGTARHASTHAAGVLIAPGRLDDVVPLFKSGKGEVSTQWDMKSCETAGLLKMDFLGLSTLTVIEDALDLIEERTGDRPVMRTLPFDDKRTFDLLRSGDTTAVFQLKSSGMKDLLRKLGPETFEDIIAVEALYRPGPMGSGMVDDFIACKHGKKEIRYEHPSLKPILEATYGMMVYQEQVMQIASTMAGFTLGEADLLRRAMGKKKKEEMDAQQIKFVEGATTRGIPREAAEKVFEQMAFFAGYGFNKSHSAAYALVTYHTAWLKAHYPAEFMAANLTNDMGNTDKVMVLVEECRRMGIPVHQPNLNLSRAKFRVVEGKSIQFGLGAVKNVGMGAIEAMTAERDANGLFTSIFDLCRRVDHHHLNRRVLESLICAGAFDEFDVSRAAQFAAVPMALDGGARHQSDAARGQTSLFGDVEGGEEVESGLPDVPRWERSIRLRHEKEVLGFYLSDHPLAAYRDEISAVATGDAARLKTMGDGCEVGLLGVISAVVKKFDKKGRPMGFAQVEDFSGNLECVFFASVFEGVKDFLEVDRVVLVRGRLDRRDSDADPKLVATEAVDFEANRSNLAHTLNLRVPIEGLEEGRLTELHHLLERYPGRGDVVMHLELESGRRVRVKLTRFRVGVDQTLLRELRALLGEDAVRLGGSANGRNGR